jgi:hypothetical protein
MYVTGFVPLWRKQVLRPINVSQEIDGQMREEGDEKGRIERNKRN